MFEDKTYKNLMAKCMSYAPEDIDTSEGSVMYDVAGPLCMLLAENFADENTDYDRRISKVESRRIQCEDKFCNTLDI